MKSRLTWQSLGPTGPDGSWWLSDLLFLFAAAGSNCWSQAWDNLTGAGRSTRPQPSFVTQTRPALLHIQRHRPPAHTAPQLWENKQTSYFRSPTWLSSFSAAILRLGSIVPFRAWIIRLGSICVQFHGSFCVFKPHTWSVSWRYCPKFSRALWAAHTAARTGTNTTITKTTSAHYIKNKRLHWRRTVKKRVVSSGGAFILKAVAVLFCQTVAGLTEKAEALPRFTGNVKQSKQTIYGFPPLLRRRGNLRWELLPPWVVELL